MSWQIITLNRTLVKLFRMKNRMDNTLKSKNYNSKKGCPPKYHKRAGYTNKVGHYVPPRCIHSTTVYTESSAQKRDRITRKQERRLRAMIPSIHSLKRRECPPGKIARKSYVRRYTSAVRAKGFEVHRKNGKTYRVYPKSKPTVVQTKCVKDLGLPGKGPREGKGVGPLRKGELKKHGYSFRNPELKRKAALNSAVKEFGALGVYHKLNAVAKLAVRTAPNAAKTFKVDRNWIKQRYGPLKAAI